MESIDRGRGSEQGQVSEPEEIAAEDVVGAEETPTPRQLGREQAIVGEPVAESEQRIAEAAAPASAADDVGDEEAPADRPTAGPVPAVEDEEEEVEDDVTPRVKPEIPGADLEVDIVREGEEALREEDEEAEGEGAAFEAGELGAGSGDLYEQAVAVVLRDKKASTSYIQRRLQIGYNRAASLMERMEKEGIVGPANHAGKREILLEGADADE